MISNRSRRFNKIRNIFSTRTSSITCRWPPTTRRRRHSCLHTSVVNSFCLWQRQKVHYPPSPSRPPLHPCKFSGTLDVWHDSLSLSSKQRCRCLLSPIWVLKLELSGPAISCLWSWVGLLREEQATIWRLFIQGSPSSVVRRLFGPTIGAYFVLSPPLFPTLNESHTEGFLSQSCKLNGMWRG